MYSKSFGKVTVFVMAGIVNNIVVTIVCGINSKGFIYFYINTTVVIFKIMSILSPPDKI